MLHECVRQNGQVPHLTPVCSTVNGLYATHVTPENPVLRSCQANSFAGHPGHMH